MSLPVDQRLGRLQQAILALLWDDELYGLEIQKDISVYGFRVTSGQLYPALKRLEENGYISSFERVKVGATRKYYKITEAGKRVLIENVLDQVKILEILATRNLSKLIIDSGYIDVDEEDIVVEISNLWFKDITNHIMNKIGSGYLYLAVGDEKESSLIRDWTVQEEIDDRVGIVLEKEKSLKLHDNSVNLVLILFRLHTLNSNWILSEAKRALKEQGRLIIIDLLDIGDDFRSDFYGGILPGHSRMGVDKNKLITTIKEIDLTIEKEEYQKGLIILQLKKKE